MLYSEHRTKSDLPMHQNVTDCTEFEKYLRLHAPPDIDTSNNIVSKDLHLHNAAIKNTELFDHNDKGSFI